MRLHFLLTLVIITLFLSGCTKFGPKEEPTTTTILTTTTTLAPTTTTTQPNVTINATENATIENETISTTTVGPRVDGIILETEYVDTGKIKLIWDVVGESPGGFYVLWSKNSGPTYPLRDEDEFQYMKSPKAREITIANLENKTYYFRVCENFGDECGTYSNGASKSATANSTTT